METLFSKPLKLFIRLMSSSNLFERKTDDGEEFLIKMYTIEKTNLFSESVTGILFPKPYCGLVPNLCGSMPNK